MSTFTNYLRIFSIIFITQLFFFCNKQTDENSSASIPALFERQGELAKASEWPKTKEKVTELIELISKNPKDTKSRLQIAVIYLSEARITGEHPYYYPAILKILDGVLAIEPQNFEATTFKSSVKLSLHQFAEAREIAQNAAKINPNNAYVYGVLVDANVELGNYEEAIKMSDIMQSLKPSLESYSRASYLREIYGDYNGSIEAMVLAVQAGLPGSEPHCWSKNTLGHLYEITGQYDKAEEQYLEILALRPSYAFALQGLSNVYVARKEYDKALTELDKAAAIMPEFSFHEHMADIYKLMGDDAKANTKYKSVVEMLDEDVAAGHIVDLELCKLYTKTNDLDSAMVYGMKEFAKRPKNIDVNHALAAVYFADKNYLKAQEHINSALVTGNTAPELMKLASAIESSLGNNIMATKYLTLAKKTNSLLIL